MLTLTWLIRPWLMLIGAMWGPYTRSLVSAPRREIKVSKEDVKHMLHSKLHSFLFTFSMYYSSSYKVHRVLCHGIVSSTSTLLLIHPVQSLYCIVYILITHSYIQVTKNMYYLNKLNELICLHEYPYVCDLSVLQSM